MSPAPMRVFSAELGGELFREQIHAFVKIVAAHFRVDFAAGHVGVRFQKILLPSVLHIVIEHDTQRAEAGL